MTRFLELTKMAFADAAKAERWYDDGAFRAALRSDPESVLGRFGLARIPRREIPRAWWLRLADDAVRGQGRVA